MRLEAERLEQERIEAGRLEQQRLEAERSQKEQQRLEAEKLEAQRLEAKGLEQKRTAAKEAERLAQLAREEERRFEDRWKETIDGGAHPPSRLDSLRGAFLAAGSLMRSSAASGPSNSAASGSADDLDTVVTSGPGDRSFATAADTVGEEGAADDDRDHGGNNTSVAESFDTAMCSMDAMGRTVDEYLGVRDEAAGGEEAQAAEERGDSISNELSDIIVRSGGVKDNKSRSGEVVDDVADLEDFVNGIVLAVDGDESHDFDVDGEDDGGDDAACLDSPVQEIEINIFREQNDGSEGGEETTAESPVEAVDILDRMQRYVVFSPALLPSSTSFLTLEICILVIWTRSRTAPRCRRSLQRNSLPPKPKACPRDAWRAKTSLPNPSITTRARRLPVRRTWFQVGKKVLPRLLIRDRICRT